MRGPCVPRDRLNVSFVLGQDEDNDKWFSIFLFDLVFFFLNVPQDDNDGVICASQCDDRWWRWTMIHDAWTFRLSSDFPLIVAHFRPTTDELRRRHDHVHRRLHLVIDRVNLCC